MQKLLKSVVSAIPVGILVAFLWHWVNSAFGNKNGGFLENSPWPLSDIYLCVVIAVVLAICGSFFAFVLSDKRRKDLELAAGLLGMSYEEKLSRNSVNVQGRMHLFDDWVKATNLIHGSVNDIDVQIFDLKQQYTTRSHSSSGSSRQTHSKHQTVFLMPLPEGFGVSLQLMQKGSFGWLLGAMGFDGIEFELDDSFATDEDRRVLAQFNEKYLVVQGLVRGGTGINSTPIISKDSEEVMKTLEERFSLDLLKELATGRGYSVELCESHVAIWQHQKKIRAADIPTVLGEVTAIYELLIGGVSDRQRMKLSATGQASLRPEASVGRFGVIAASGCAGMFLAFALFVPVFFLFVEKAPWIVFVWPFFGMAVVAGSVFVGTRLANKFRKSRSTSFD